MAPEPVTEVMEEEVPLAVIPEVEEEATEVIAEEETPLAAVAAPICTTHIAIGVLTALYTGYEAVRGKLRGDKIKKEKGDNTTGEEK